MNIFIVLLLIIVALAVVANLLSRWFNPLRLTFYLKSNHKVSINVSKWDRSTMGRMSWHVAFKTSPTLKNISTEDIIAVKVVHRWFNLSR